MAEPNKLITEEFLALNLIVFLTFCNIAVFFQFHNYLGTLPIAPEWFGLLIALFSLSALVLRPIISPFLRPDNAKRWIFISCWLVIGALVLYGNADGLWSMALLRVIHGAAYTLLAVAVLSKLVGCIPPDRSGQAFGAISVITLLPYAVMPPLLKPLTQWAGGFDKALDLCALLMALCFPLLLLVDRHQEGGAAQAPDRIGWQDLTSNLKDYSILLLMVLSLLVWTCFTPVFFFLKGYGDKIGVPNPGWFFTLSTMTEIGVRLVAGHLFDRLDKAKVLVGATAGLALGYFMLAHLSNATIFYAMGLLLGLGWGVAMPVLSGLVFDVSEPRFRALNTNLSMEMFQAGFFVGPVVGGVILANWGYAALYYSCGGLGLAALAAGLPLMNTTTRVRSNR
jgi:MFS family permease